MQSAAEFYRRRFLMNIFLPSIRCQMKPFETNLSNLRYFLIACEHGSFRRSAAALNIEESRISRRIRELEEPLGVSLFYRRHDGVRPTAAGREFLLTERLILESADEGAARVAIGRRSEEGVLRVGICFSMGTSPLRTLLIAMKKERHGVKINLFHSSFGNLLRSLSEEQIDFAFVPAVPYSSDLETMSIWRERICIAIQSDHRLAHREAVEWKGLHGETIIRCDQNIEHLDEIMFREFKKTDICPIIETHQVSRCDLLT